MANFVVTYDIKKDKELREKIKDALTGKGLKELIENQSTHYGPYADAKSLMAYIRVLVKEDKFQKGDFITVFYCQDNNMQKHNLIDDGEKH